MDSSVMVANSCWVLDADKQKSGERVWEKKDKTYGTELLVDGSELGRVSRVRLAAHQDLVSPLDPSLSRHLAKIDLLAFVSARVGIECNPKVPSVSVSHVDIFRDCKRVNALLQLG